MALFRLDVPRETKPVSQHPWSRIIKDALSHRVKYAHNSVKNPKYPVKEDKHKPNADRVKFTIIGDRVTQDFIYCKNLVQGLYKYRWKVFDTPVIRGVTTVEWPDVLKDLKNRFGGLAFCLQSSVAVLINDKFLGGVKELKELIDTKYIYNVFPDYCKETVSEFAKFIRASGRPCAYMQISIGGKRAGTLIFMLFNDIVPYTCENFLRLCKETRGGYGGTPIHRVVKDSWIQGGGFGLKDTDLQCENFIIPHDRRGVLCMSNDGRHVDCSTQFFVLLQPMPWMAYKYVAFGQLIEGEETLKNIENVETWYESPKSEIIITKAGIFNMECHDIMINKNAKEYIFSHIEDLVALGELFYEALLERVFLEAQMRELERMRQQELADEGAEEHGENDNENDGIHATKRFIRKKEDIEKQLQRNKTEKVDENKEFDVEEYEYEYEPEEQPYQHVSLPEVLSPIIRDEKPFYLPLTDVPYPGEVDSTFDLKRFLQGHYCLEIDVKQPSTKKVRVDTGYNSTSMLFDFESSEEESVKSLDSDEEKEIEKYLKANVDRVSFAGDVIKNIARGKAKVNIFEEARKSELITDDQLRRFRLQSVDQQRDFMHHKKVSISVPTEDRSHKHHEIKRRQTGFVRPQDLEKIHVFRDDGSDDDDDDDDDEDDQGERKVRIAVGGSESESKTHGLRRRPTGFVRTKDLDDSDIDVQRPSVLARLYGEYEPDDGDYDIPTLKDYKPHESHNRPMSFLTSSPNNLGNNDENDRERYVRQSMTKEQNSYEQVLDLQHGKKIARKISSDYVKTIDQIEHKIENSIRSAEFAKTRPTMSVAEYQKKNRKYQEELKQMSGAFPQTQQSKAVMKHSQSHVDAKQSTGDSLRVLPGSLSTIEIK